MAETEKPFAYLHENIPQWLCHLDQVQEKIAHMQSEIAKMPAPARPSMRRKTGSIESIRELDAILVDAGPSAAPASAPAPAPASAQHPEKLTLKRKPTSRLSGDGSGPIKYRTRAMTIVYYDGQIQKQFESLVRSIGSGRNLLRKGKMAVMAARMEAMADFSSSDEDEPEEDHVENVMSKIQFRRRTGLSSARSGGPPRGRHERSASTNSTPESVFDSVDKALEQAQALCERAAHQSLRDGQCRNELDGTRKYLREVLEAAAKETARHKAWAQRQPQLESPPASTAPRARTAQIGRAHV